jgi:hypothetical protein
MHQQPDPVRLLQREDRLREWKKRHQNEPFERGGQHCPRDGYRRDGTGRQPGGPAAERAEEYQRPRKVRPLVKRDADRDGGPGRFNLQRPIPRRNSSHGHPVHGRVASETRRGKLADQRRIAAAD